MSFCELKRQTTRRNIPEDDNFNTVCLFFHTHITENNRKFGSLLEAFSENNSRTLRSWIERGLKILERNYSIICMSSDDETS